VIGREDVGVVDVGWLIRESGDEKCRSVMTGGIVAWCLVGRLTEDVGSTCLVHEPYRRVLNLLLSFTHPIFHS